MYPKFTEKNSAQPVYLCQTKILPTANISHQEIFQPKLLLNRSSYWRCSVIKGVVRNFAKFTGKHLCQSIFLTDLQA